MSRIGPLGEMGRDQPLVARLQTGKTRQGRAGQALVAGEPVVIRLGLAGGQGRQPQIEVTIEARFREAVDDRR